MIKIKNNELKIPIILNLVLVFVIYSDYYLPSQNIVEEKFESFYNVVKNLPRIKGGGGKEIRYILECASGNLYHLHSFPENNFEIKKGQKIFISKTLFLLKVKSLKISKESKGQNISLLSNNFITFLFLLAILITFANFIFTNRILDVFLSFSCAYIYLVSLLYLLYY